MCEAKKGKGSSPLASPPMCPLPLPFFFFLENAKYRIIGLFFYFIYFVVCCLLLFFLFVGWKDRELLGKWGVGLEWLGESCGGCCIIGALLCFALLCVVCSFSLTRFKNVFFVFACLKKSVKSGKGIAFSCGNFFLGGCVFFVSFSSLLGFVCFFCLYFRFVLLFYSGVCIFFFLVVSFFCFF